MKPKHNVKCRKDGIMGIGLTLAEIINSSFTHLLTFIALSPGKQASVFP